MKVLTKQRLKNKDRLRTILERQILTDLAHHNFVVNCHWAFQDRDDLYLILDYVSNGDLFSLLNYEFTELQVSFIIAQLVLALTHLHRNNIIYRDLKPENILLDDQGYIKLTDFGLSKQLASSQETTNSFCGTVEYMAPEIIKREGHGTVTDFWSLGILIYEMLFGKLPFRSPNNNRRETMELIVKAKLRMPGEISKNTQLMLRDCLKRKPEKRIGYGTDGEAVIKNHTFFSWLDWNELYRKEMRSPIMNIISASQKSNKISQTDKNKYKEFGMNEKRNNVNAAPVSEECHTTFLKFDFVPETPKDETSDFSFSLLTKKMSTTMISDEVKGLPVIPSKQNSQNVQNQNLDGSSQTNGQIAHSTISPQNTTNNTNNNQPNAENKKRRSRSSSPDSGSFHDNKIECAQMTYDIKHRLSIKLYENFCQHASFLPVVNVNQDFQSIMMAEAAEHFEPRIDVEFDEAKEKFDEHITLKDRINLLPKMEAFSEKECQSILKHLGILLLYIHKYKCVINMLTSHKIGYKSKNSGHKFIKILDLTCLEDISSNDQEFQKGKLSNFLSYCHIMEEILYKNFEVYNRRISNDLRGFRVFITQLRDSAIQEMQTCKYSNKEYIRDIWQHPWVCHPSAVTDVGILVDRSSLEGHAGSGSISSSSSNNSNGSILIQPTSRLPAIPPQANPLNLNPGNQHQNVISHSQPNANNNNTQHQTPLLQIPPFVPPATRAASQRSQRVENGQNMQDTTAGFTLGNITGSGLAMRRAQQN